MIPKRLIGVVTVKDGWAVQSFGYRRWLPLGRPEVVVENLDRWGADEILLQCIDRGDRGPDIALLERLCKRGLSTPLIYQGGIGSVADGVAVIQTGAERLALDGLLRHAPQTVAALAEPLGAQALIAALPLSLHADGTPLWLDHVTRRSTPVPDAVLALLRGGAVSETLIVDWVHEGQPEGFDSRLLDRFQQAFSLPDVRLIAFGGLSSAAALRAVLDRPQVVAAAVGNFLSHREHAIQALKEDLRGLPLRGPSYNKACHA